MNNFILVAYALFSKYLSLCYFTIIQGFLPIGLRDNKPIIIVDKIIKTTRLL